MKNFDAAQIGCNGRLKATEQFVLLIRVQSENASQIGCNVTLPKKFLLPSRGFKSC